MGIGLVLQLFGGGKGTFGRVVKAVDIDQDFFAFAGTQALEQAFAHHLGHLVFAGLAEEDGGLGFVIVHIERDFAA